MLLMWNEWSLSRPRTSAQRSALFLPSELESNPLFPLGFLVVFFFFNYCFVMVIILNWKGGTFFLVCQSLGRAPE